MRYLGADSRRKENTKPAAVITKAPEGNDLTATGEARELVTAGEESVGTVEYAVSIITPTTWSSSIPTASAAGTYYVWYRARGDANHNDVDPVCIKVTIVPDTQVQAVVEGLKTLPEDVKRDDEELVEALRKMYDGLTEDQKSQIHSFGFSFR